MKPYVARTLYVAAAIGAGALAQTGCGITSGSNPAPQKKTAENAYLSFVTQQNNRRDRFNWLRRDSKLNEQNQIANADKEMEVQRSIDQYLRKVSPLKLGDYSTLMANGALVDGKHANGLVLRMAYSINNEGNKLAVNSLETVNKLWLDFCYRNPDGTLSFEKRHLNIADDDLVIAAGTYAKEAGMKNIAEKIEPGSYAVLSCLNDIEHANKNVFVRVGSLIYDAGKYGVESDPKALKAFRIEKINGIDSLVSISPSSVVAANVRLYRNPRLAATFANYGRKRPPLRISEIVRKAEGGKTMPALPRGQVSVGELPRPEIPKAQPYAIAQNEPTPITPKYTTDSRTGGEDKKLPPNTEAPRSAPTITDIITTFSIKPTDYFLMRPGSYFSEQTDSLEPFTPPAIMPSPPQRKPAPPKLDERIATHLPQPAQPQVAPQAEPKAAYEAPSITAPQPQTQPPQAELPIATVQSTPIIQLEKIIKDALNEKEIPMLRAIPPASPGMLPETPRQLTTGMGQIIIPPYQDHHIQAERPRDVGITIQPYRGTDSTGPLQQQTPSLETIQPQPSASFTISSDSEKPIKTQLFIPPFVDNLSNVSQLTKENRIFIPSLD